LPSPWTELEPGIRRVLTQRFPYGVLYPSEDSGAFILAVMHLSREPGYWKDWL
jgi:toxin ParE1/3/4